MSKVPKHDGHLRVAIENVRPEVDGGQFAIKRTVGERVVVEADVFADGHDELGVSLFYRVEGERTWHETPMTLLGNDHWRGEFVVEEQKPRVYKIEAWVDRFGTWVKDLRKWVDAGQDVEQELVTGAELVAQASANAPGDDGKWLLQRAEGLSRQWPQDVRADLAFEEELAERMRRFESRDPLTVYDAGQRVWVDRERARFSAWYELFPRSTSRTPEKPGNFRTTIERLPYIAELGFDVLYLPPIHPIGRTHRKGRNNNPAGEEGAVGSPWAIGNEAGGHDAINPDLGTLEDFRALVKAANVRGIDVAMDLALQCSPDHPWVKEHPQWFRHRPDGSIRYAENPPKRYEDIYPIDFETEDWRGLWAEVDRVVRHWVAQGVRIFRVDNPHTKAFAFWQWLIAGVQKDNPDVLFLAEAFTRPRTMYRLAKLGFSQSYTYFTWRTSKWDFTQYMTELTQTDVREYFRPNFWPNTPDILHEYVQHGGRPAFLVRLLLAATLSSNYGIYGPTFELCVNTPREPGSEEYLDSEKYEVRHWDLEAPWSLRDVIARVNQIRRENAALQYNDGFSLLDVSNESLLAYSKVSPDGANRIVCVINLDPYNTQAGSVRIPRAEWGIEPGEPAEMLDLIDHARYGWMDEWNYVELNPHVLPGHVLQLQLRENPAGGQAESIT
jgi:starch synthase (maltosyl-transferring)